MDISTIIIYLKDLIATIMTLLMMMSPAFGHTGAAYQAKDPDKLIMSFAAVSDTHVETNNPESYENLKNVLEGMKGGENIDAAVYLGDNVMNGQFLENVLFYNAVKAISPAKENFVVMGNHDIGNGTGDFEEHKNNFVANNRLYLGNDIGDGYYYRVVNGCYMIFIASEELTVNDCAMSKAQYDWLKSVLDEAKAADAPTLVFNHHPANYFRGIPEGALESGALVDLLKNYEGILYLHGHIHDDLGEDNFYQIEGINCVNLPRVTETVDYAPGDGVVVEVYENEIVVRGRDFIKGEWIEGLDYTYAY